MFNNKICKECGKEFTPKCGTQVYCTGPHTSICVICNKKFEYTCSPNEKPKTCSIKCQGELRKLTVKTKYGVDNVSKLQEVKDKISEVNSSERVRTKREATCMRKYGVDNPAKNSEIREKLSTIMKSDSYLKGREHTCLKIYGYKNPMHNESVKKKRELTCLSKYGIEGHFPTKETLSKKMIDGSKVDNYLSFKNDPITYIKTHYESNPTISILENDLGVTNTPIYDILVAHNASDLLDHTPHTYSTMENDVVEYIESLDNNIKLLRNDRNMISPYELDIYLPEYNIAFECNPACTHNSSIKDPWGSPPKHYLYHYNKSLKCENKGILLFHIFGYEWKNKNDIIKSMIRTLLNKNNIKIGARKCDTCEITYYECKKFLDLNHRQGSLSAPIRLALKYNDKIVSVMTFGKMRPGIGAELGHDKVYELSRFCSLQNHQIQGAASKLLNYFIKTYKPIKIISYSDIAHTSGKLYQKLNFTHTNTSTPSYIWTDINDNIYYHRMRCQKRFLRKLLNDYTINIENNTENEIMTSHQFVRVYDCGVKRWERIIDDKEM